MQGKFQLGTGIKGSMPDTCCIDDKRIMHLTDRKLAEFFSKSEIRRILNYKQHLILRSFQS